jgi:hypothetical protein
MLDFPTPEAPQTSVTIQELLLGYAFIFRTFRGITGER